MMEPNVGLISGSEVRQGTSSVEVNLNGKGEASYKVKVYEGSTPETMTAIATLAVSTMAGLVAGSYGTVH